MLSVREIQERDIPSIIQYWMGADATFLQGMGVDTAKMPTREAWVEMLSDQIGKRYDQKISYCTIWEIDGEAVGHCNVTGIIFGEEAHMHLHLWKSATRRKGCGPSLVRLSLPYFFHNLELKVLYSTPYALNPAPNKALERAGFRFVKEYRGIPGSFSFEQQAMLWELSREMFEGGQG